MQNFFNIMKCRLDFNCIRCPTECDVTRPTFHSICCVILLLVIIETERAIEKMKFMNDGVLFDRAKDVTKKLSEFRLGSDSTFLDRLKKNAFSKYMSTYIRYVSQYFLITF